MNSMNVDRSSLRFCAKPMPMVPVETYVWRLGVSTRLDPQNGNVLLNFPLIESLVKYRKAVIQPLFKLLQSSTNGYQIIEGLYLAQRLAEEKVKGVNALYPAAARFNYTQDPLIQVYLAGFYRKLDVPDSFGPLLEMAWRHAQQPRTQAFQTGLNPMEEIGGTLLQQIANHTARELAKRIPANSEHPSETV